MNAHYKAVNIWRSKRIGVPRVEVGSITYYFDEKGQEIGYHGPLGFSENTKGREWGWNCVKNLEITDVSPNRNRIYVDNEEFFELHKNNLTKLGVAV